MRQLRDYGGPFIPDVKYEDFSQNVHVQLLNLCSDYIQKIDGSWYVAVLDRMGDDMAFQCNRWVWERLQIWEIERIVKLFKIEGNDVAAVMKYFQVMPWASINPKNIELKDKGHGIVTMTDCPLLRAYEKEGEGREMRMCHEWEPVLMRRIADFFNPKIEVNALKLPPRKSKEEASCQWEFKLA